MPSGAKRRKAAAAKKKKEQESPTVTPSGSQATSFNGGADLKGKISNDDEVTVPSSHDPIQSGGQSFAEEDVDRDSPHVQIDTEKFNEEGVSIVKVNEDDSRVEITRELMLDEVEKGRRHLSVEVGKNSDGSSSSSSSLDDEEVHIDKFQVVPDSPVVVQVYEVVENSVDSQMTAAVLEDLVKTADESQEAAIVFEELMESSDDSQVPAVVLDEVVETADESLVPPADLEEAVDTPDEAHVPTVVLEEVVYVSESVPVEKVYEDLGKPVLSELKVELKAAEDGNLPPILPAGVSLGESSNVNPFIAKDVEDNVLPPSDSPIAVTRNGVGHHPIIPEIQNSFDDQHMQTPLLQAPLSDQRTSLMGCCGLFEVFKGSR